MSDAITHFLLPGHNTFFNLPFYSQNSLNMCKNFKWMILGAITHTQGAITHFFAPWSVVCSLNLCSHTILGGCYTGIGGIAFSFLRVALAFKDKQKDYLIQANKFLESQMKYAKVFVRFSALTN